MINRFREQARSHRGNVVLSALQPFLDEVHDLQRLIDGIGGNPPERSAIPVQQVRFEQLITRTFPAHRFGDDPAANRAGIQAMATKRGAGPDAGFEQSQVCLLYTSPSPRDRTRSRMPSSA